MEERWWDLWAAECRRQLATFDLGWAPIVDGRTAVVCWTEGGVPRIVLDRPLAEILMAQDAGFLMVPWIHDALQRYQATGRVTTVRLPRPWRRRRRGWLRRSA
ncbi:MAG: hypothetical protein C7B43_14600 [Sulfobacillus benefaciens]|jgi:hypothetical protein|uniref:Uncharacterized protein n=1 Tax=Sulfobacillus benefaciens TaxID=453960 RepID=A0A2T2WVC1_9FIRM|nr:MAG: hypothetical protein C7B43_14600 [Sulfobacillus benefaciens]